MPRFKYADGTVPNCLVFGYVVAGQLLALALLVAPSWPANVVGVLLSTHTLMIAGYLMHEAIHETIFATHAANGRLGAAICWYAGGGWAGWEAVRKKHIRHHADRMDLTTFDLRAFLDRSPRITRVVEALEWAYVPAVELLLRVEHALRPFHDARHAGSRRRVLLVAAGSLAWWGGLWLVSPRACLLWGLSYLLFVSGLRLFDAFHHDLELEVVEDVHAPYVMPPERDRAFEQAHTFSNVLLPGWPLADLLVLNFSYHNAHHAKPGVPWHRLPALDEKLSGPAPRHETSIWDHLGAFHRHRVARVRVDQTAVAPGPDGTVPNIGAVAVSLLTI